MDDSGARGSAGELQPMTPVVAIIPLFNHARTVAEVLEAVAPHVAAIIVVDDGSTDGGADAAEAWFQLTGTAGTVLRLPENRGKAAALLAGFASARARGATHALSIDADGQHDASQIPAFLDRLADEEIHAAHLLVLGNRRPLPRAYPLSRLVGRTLSGLAVRAACGVGVGDAACGMRLYPLELALEIRCHGGRYAWEEEAITRMVWHGALVREVAIPVIYRDAAQAPSHYRFVRDWTEGAVVLTLSILIRLVPLGNGGRATWSSEGEGDLWWPLRIESARGRFGALLAIVTLAFGATIHGIAALLTPGPFGSLPATYLLATALLLWVVWRTRAPILAAALGATLGLAAPLTSLGAIAPMAPLLAVWTIRRQRSSGA